jgi:hypothetical protein
VVITALHGATAQVIRTNDTSTFAYAAPNGINARITNNCLEDATGGEVEFPGLAQGFAVIQPQVSPPKYVLQEYQFTFAGLPAGTVNQFSLNMFDYGDLNPRRVTHHSVLLEGYASADCTGPLVISQELSYDTPGVLNPRSSSNPD